MALIEQAIDLGIDGMIMYKLVGGLEHVLFSIIYGIILDIILPIDFHIFQDG